MPLHEFKFPSRSEMKKMQEQRELEEESRRAAAAARYADDVRKHAEMCAFAAANPDKMRRCTICLRLNFCQPGSEIQGWICDNPECAESLKIRREHQAKLDAEDELRWKYGGRFAPPPDDGDEYGCCYDDRDDQSESEDRWEEDYDY
jgi:hypothetical protein